MVVNLYFPLHYIVHSLLIGSSSRFYSMGLPCRLTVSEYLHFKIYNRKLRRYYQKHSISEISPNDHVVLYFLHLEPEASIMNRTVYNSQIYNLKMLAKSLPSGWKLYVKEHPASFNVNLVSGATIMRTMERYRSIKYYQELLRIPNLYLLDWKYPSTLLVSEKSTSVKAVATINGTVSLECLRSKKPVILFDDASCCYEGIADIFRIHSYDDLQDAMDVLYSCEFTPKYSNFEEILGKYLIIQNSEWGPLEIPDGLFEHILEKLSHYSEMS